MASVGAGAWAAAGAGAAVAVAVLLYLPTPTPRLLPGLEHDPDLPLGAVSAVQGKVELDTRDLG